MKNRQKSEKSKHQSTVKIYDKIIRFQPKLVLTRLTDSEINLSKRERENELLLLSDVVECKVPKLKVIEKPSSMIVSSEMEPIIETSSKSTNYVDERNIIIGMHQNQIFALKEVLANRDSWFKTEIEQLKKEHMKEVESVGESLAQLQKINQKSDLHRNMMLDANEKLTKTTSEKNLLIAKLKVTEEERECLLNQIKTFHSIKRDQIRKLNDERCAAMDNMSRIHNREMQVLKKFHENKTAKDYDSYIDEIGNLKETIEQLKSTLSNQEKIWLDKNEKSYESHREILNRHIADNERLQKRIQDLEKKSRKDDESNDQGIELLTKSHDILKQQHECERERWKEATEAAFKTIQKKNGDRIKEIQIEHSEMIRKLEFELDDKSQKMNKELAQRDSQIKMLRENRIRNITKLKLELAKSIETNDFRIKNLEQSNYILQFEKEVLIGKCRTEQIQLVGKLDIAEKEILNLRQMMEQTTKVSAMRENAANGQNFILNQELMSIRSKHQESIRDHLTQISILKQTLEQTTKDAEMRERVTHCRMNALNNEIISTRTRLAQQIAINQKCWNEGFNNVPHTF